MVCRSVPGASVPIALARVDSDLDDPQVQSLMHQLRHECPPGYASRAALQADTVDDDEGLRRNWAGIRGEMSTAVRLHPVVGGGRALGMAEKLRGANDVPPADLQYACQRIRDRAIAAAAQLDQTLRATAVAQGVQPHEIRARFEQLRAEAPRGRSARATPDERDRWQGLPLDPATRHALTHLDTWPTLSAEAGPPVIAADSRHPVHDPQGLVHRYGYDPASGRLELFLSDGRQLAYRNVPAQTAEQLGNGRRADSVWQELRNQARHRYPTTDVAAAYGVRRRCSTCGQFASLEHRCRGPAASATAGSVLQAAPSAARTQTVTLPEPFDDAAIDIRTYDLDDLTDQLEDAEHVLQVPVTAGAEQEPAYVRGHVLVQLSTDEDTGAALVAVRSDADLGCNCYEDRWDDECDHVDRTLAGLRMMLDQHRHDRTRRIGELAERLAARHRRTETPPADAAPSRCSFNYSDDPDLFATHVRAVLEGDGDDRVPWRTAAADDTILGDGVSPRRHFGVELEFSTDPWAPRFGEQVDDEDLPGAELMPADDEGRWGSPPTDGDAEVLHLDGEPDPGTEVTVRARVGNRLLAADLTADAQQRDYHAKRREGYEAGPWFTWSYESDDSVDGGEVVSPILADHAEDWRALRTACRTITDGGGIASGDAGSHVTISADEFAGDADRINRLLAVVEDYEGPLQTMATAGHDRTTDAAVPLDDRPAAGYLSVRHAKRMTSTHSAINIEHIPSTRSADQDGTDVEDTASHDGCRIEFRLWDGSLEPGRIQAQVAVSAALVDYASRTARHPVQRPHQRRPWRRVAPGHPEFGEATAAARELIDLLAASDGQKRQFAALWAAGAYPGPGVTR